MKNIKSVMVGSLLGGLALVGIAATAVGRPTPSFEYRIVSGSVRDGDLQRAMNTLQDWELASVEPLTGNDGFAVFRRQKR